MSSLAEEHQIVDSVSALPWYAVRVRSNYERVATQHLCERGFEEFWPSVKTEAKWSDRKKTIERSLFPGYIFCRFDPQHRLPILTVPGVVGLVGFGKEPCPIPNHEVENVRALVRSGLLVSPFPFLREGQLVILEKGPLAGVEGVVQELKGKLRVVVSVNLLQRSISAEIDRAWVRPLKAAQSYTRLTHGEWVLPRAL